MLANTRLAGRAKKTATRPNCSNRAVAHCRWIAGMRYQRRYYERDDGYERAKNHIRIESFLPPTANIGRFGAKLEKPRS